jgi:hypothetical protein
MQISYLERKRLEQISLETWIVKTEILEQKVFRSKIVGPNELKAGSSFEQILETLFWSPLFFLFVGQTNCQKNVPTKLIKQITPVLTLTTKIRSDF